MTTNDVLQFFQRAMLGDLFPLLLCAFVVALLAGLLMRVNFPALIILIVLALLVAVLIHAAFEFFEVFWTTPLGPHLELK